MVALSYPLGKYIAKVYKKEKTWLDFMKPVERLMFRLSGITPEEEMNWKQFLRALLTVNLFWFVWGMVLLVSQGYLPVSYTHLDVYKRQHYMLSNSICSYIPELPPNAREYPNKWNSQKWNKCGKKSTGRLCLLITSINFLRRSKLQVRPVGFWKSGIT